MNTEIAEKLYRSMYSIRVFEERIEELFAKGELPGFVHLYLGEEACATGVCANLRTDDYITSTHRGHGHCIAKGGKLDRMMAELHGKKTGYNHGKGGSMHLACTDLGILGANGINAGGVAIAVGAAKSAMMQKMDKVSVAFLGDGATNQGTFHEAVNLAAVWNAPIVFAIENNQFGVGTRFSDASKEIDIAKRAIGYGIPGVIVDGQDVVAVYNAAKKAIDDARNGKGPSILEMKTWRYRGHFQGEPAAQYRTLDEEKEWKLKDPIQIAKKKFLADQLLTQEKISQIEKEITQELEEAVEFARNSPDPELESALMDVFA